MNYCKACHSTENTYLSSYDETEICKNCITKMPCLSGNCKICNNYDFLFRKKDIRILVCYRCLDKPNIDYNNYSEDYDAEFEYKFNNFNIIELNRENTKYLNNNNYDKNKCIVCDSDNTNNISKNYNIFNENKLHKIIYQFSVYDWRYPYHMDIEEMCYSDGKEIISNYFYLCTDCYLCSILKHYNECKDLPTIRKSVNWFKTLRTTSEKHQIFNNNKNLLDKLKNAIHHNYTIQWNNSDNKKLEQLLYELTKK